MMIMDRFSPTRLLRQNDVLIGRFDAMGCSCEVLIDTENIALARTLLEAVSQEAWRIETKFSRYRQGNIVDQINQSEGRAIQVDEETAQLIDFAQEAYALSDGLFDVTSGVLRKLWRFDGSAHLPSGEDVRKLLPLVGWDKVRWKRPVLQLLSGMEIDLGGLGKEYAVDRAAQLVCQRSPVGFLINFGGDIAVGGERCGGRSWTVGIEDNNAAGQAVTILHINRGAVATSGDSKKYALANGRRYGHILDPRSGWPTPDAPRSVTVTARSCTEAGFLSTVALLHGKGAASFLDNMGARHWCYWN